MPKCKRLFHGSAALATLLALGACSNITRSTSDDLAVTPQANSTYRVSTSADDAEEDNASGTTVTNSKILDLGSQTVGIRFQQIAIPQGAQVRNAYLEFTGSANATGFADFLIYGHASDNSPPFVAGSGSRNISARAKTINSKVWTPAARLAGDVYQPDVTAIVQGLVIRSGWRSGNAMSFMISGSGLRQVDAFDAGTGNGPRLIVDYVSSSALPSCLDDNSDRLFTPTGEYNTTYNSVRDTAGARIDASGAEFSPDVLKGSGPMTAFVARNNNRLCLSGGFYTTEDSPGVHDEAAWKPYLHDGGTILMEDTPNSIVENVAVRLTSDGVQYKAEGGNSGNWTLRHSYFYHVGDDIVENDYMWTGVIDGVLVDWAHTGISCRPGLGSFDNPQADIDQSNAGTITIRNSLIALRPQKVAASGKPGHYDLFKWNRDSSDFNFEATNGCKLRLINNVFLITNEAGYLDPAFDPEVDYNVITESTNNVLVWNGSGASPYSASKTGLYKLPTGFRNENVSYWNTRRSEWFNAHPKFEGYRSKQPLGYPSCNAPCVRN